MRSINEILFTPKDVDVVLIQPNFLMRILSSEQNEVVRSYWASMENKEPLGDTPNEVNHGLFSLAASLIEAKFSVEVLDFQAYDMFLRRTESRMIDKSDIQKAIACNRAKLYGISTITVAVANALNIGEIIHNLFPRSIVAYGGMHPTLYGEAFILEKNVDAILLGEGNKSIVDLANTIIIGNGELSAIKGIYFKNENGEVVRTPKREIDEVDLDALPYPAYSLMCSESLPLMPRFFTSKGCPFHCAFCSCDAFYNHAYDNYDVFYRDPVKVVDEIEYTYQKYEMPFYCFGDLTFMTRKSHVHAICKELIARGLSHVKWWCQTTVGSLDEEDLTLMKRAGCKQVGLGVENGTQRNLDRMGKPILADEAEVQCKLIRKCGLEPITYWIMGLGDRNFEEAVSTINRICYFVRENLTEVSHIGVPVPYPGSPIWYAPDNYGLSIISKNFSEYWMNSDELGYSRPAVETNELSSDHIYALWEYALMAVANEYDKRREKENLL